MRHHAPNPSEELEFDFSSCTGTVREAVLALVAVEKVFRLYARPGTAAARVMVDSKVEAFLKDHFVQYPVVFAHRQDGQGNGAGIAFTQLFEDDQYDDLTMLVLRKK